MKHVLFDFFIAVYKKHSTNAKVKACLGSTKGQAIQ